MKKYLVPGTVITILIGVLIFAVVKFGGNPGNKPKPEPTPTPIITSTPEPTDEEELIAEYVDAAEYYTEVSEEVTEKSISESESIMTENEVRSFLSERGFDQYPITADANIDGKLFENGEIGESTTDKHPTYQTFHVTSNGDYFTILVLDGTIYAYPLSYSIQKEMEKTIIISETEKLVCYDIVTNTYFTIKPKKELFDIIIADRIDSNSLEKYSDDMIYSLLAGGGN